MDRNGCRDSGSDVPRKKLISGPPKMRRKFWVECLLKRPQKGLTRSVHIYSFNKERRGEIRRVTRRFHETGMEPLS